MNHQFHADGHPAARLRILVKPLLQVSGFTLLNLLLDWPIWPVLLVVLFFFPILAYSSWGRGTWGDKVEVLSDRVVLYEKEKERSRIPVEKITAMTIKADCALISWNDGNKREGVVLGAEGFAPATWTELQSALALFRDQKT